MNINTKLLIQRIEKLFNNKCFVLFVLLLTTIFGVVYYYGIISAVYPNAENCIWQYSIWLNDISDKYESAAFFKLHSKSLLMQITSDIAYALNGFSFKSEWIRCCIDYGIMLFLTCVISICFGKERNNYFHALPIVIMLIIEMHVFDKNSFYGFSDTYKQAILTDYPSMYHTTPIVYGLICYLLLQLFIMYNEKKIKYVFLVLLVFGLGVSVKYGDIVFYALFLGPLAIYFFLRMFHDKKYKKIMMCISIVACFILVATKVFTHTRIHQLLWSSGVADPYYSGVYGAMDWTPNSELSGNFNQTLFLILGLFNIDRPHHTVISLWSLVMFVRILLLLLVICIMILVIRDSLLGEDSRFDIIDQMCTYGILIFVFVKTFFYTVSNVPANRYFFSILILSVILLVRNFGQIIFIFTKVDIFYDFKGRLLGFFVGCVIVLLAMENVWGQPIIDSDAEDIDKCIEYIQEHGEGYGIATFLLYTRMTLQADGKVLFFDGQEQHDKYFDPEPPRYIINNYGDDTSYVYRGYWGSLDELISVFGEPVEIVKFGNFWVHRMW